MVLHGLTPRPEDCIEMEHIHSDDTALRQLLRRKDRPTAFIVSDDLLGLVLERACAAIGLSIPQDVSIIAFNNSFFSHLASPRLTTVDINAYQLGQEAASQIIGYLENPNLRTTRVIVPHKILERCSCARITPEK